MIPEDREEVEANLKGAHAEGPLLWTLRETLAHIAFRDHRRGERAPHPAAGVQSASTSPADICANADWIERDGHWHRALELASEALVTLITAGTVSTTVRPARGGPLIRDGRLFDPLLQRRFRSDFYFPSEWLLVGEGWLRFDAPETEVRNKLTGLIFLESEIKQACPDPLATAIATENAPSSPVQTPHPVRRRGRPSSIDDFLKPQLLVRRDQGLTRSSKRAEAKELATWLTVTHPTAPKCGWRGVLAGLDKELSEAVNYVRELRAPEKDLQNL